MQLNHTFLRTLQKASGWLGGLKGRDIPAQGSALGIGIKTWTALKGRDIGLHNVLWIKMLPSILRQRLYHALSGLHHVFAPFPGALPWAGISRPFRPSIFAEPLMAICDIR